MEEAAMALDSEADRLWRAAQALAADAGSNLPPLLFFTDPARTPEPWITARALPRGAGVVHRGFGRTEAGDDAQRLRQATREAGVRLLIGLDADLAEAVGANGVHLPEHRAGLATALRRRHPDWLITAAWHPNAGPAPALDALDALVVSPVFTPGGSSDGAPLGRDGLSVATRATATPVYVLGGVDAARAETLAGTGACGIAAVEAIQAGFGPDARIRT